ncbi:MAG: hypothetical protein KAT90_04350, partial [Gammaproteobacteria bacterium]|nr:hypothetical protein [Gammaproteobacteria bacterium]
DDKQTRFIGRKLDTDLFVLSADAGIDFIEPVKTKLSFGASADIKKLKGIRFQIDLDDPENLAKVDSFLQSVGVSNRPILEPAFTGIQKKMNVFNKFANQSIDHLIEQTLEKTVENLGQAAAPVTLAGEDPVVTMSKSLAHIHNIPQQVDIFLENEITAPIDDVLITIEGKLAESLTDVVSQVLSLNANDLVPEGLITAIVNTRSLIKQKKDDAEKISIQIAQPIAQAKQLIAQVKAPVRELEDATYRINVIFTQATDVVETECLRTDALSNPESNGYLDQVTLNLKSIKDILHSFEGGDMLLPLVELISSDPQVAQRLEASQQALKRRAEVLAYHVADAETALRGQLCGTNIDLVALLHDVSTLLTQLNTTAAEVDTLLTGIDVQLNTWSDSIANVLGDTAASMGDIDQKLAALQVDLDNGLSYTGADALSNAGLPGSDVEVINHLSGVSDLARAEIAPIIGPVQEKIVQLLAKELPGASYTPEQLRQMLVKKVVASAPVVKIRMELNKHMGEINKQLNDIVIEATDQINVVVRTALAKVESGVNDVLEAATAPVNNIPLNSASLYGFGIIAGNELERFHLGAEWTMAPAEEGEPGDTFGAALDVVSRNAINGEGGCSIPEGKSILDAKITAFNMGGKIAGSDITLKELMFGFTLESGGGSIRPKGVIGSIDVIGNIGFSEFVIYDPSFRAGIGADETYLGAKANAVFSELEAEVAFLAGKTCDSNILLGLDPDVAQFIDVPDTGFYGAYVRGGASVPVWTSGCALTVKVAADFGGWVLAGSPSVVGGLVGGGASGEALCIASLKGKVMTIFQRSGDDVSFVGNGFGVAGTGWCDKETWTSVEKSRDDGGCATGDVQFGAEYSDGWSIYQLEESAFH